MRWTTAAGLGLLAALTIAGLAYVGLGALPVPAPEELAQPVAPAPVAAAPAPAPVPPAPVPAPEPAPAPAPEAQAAPVEARPDAAVHGRVLDQAGQPVSVAYVRLEGPGHNEVDEAPAEDDGSFALGHGSGPVQLTVEADGYATRKLTAQAPGEVEVTLTALATLDVSVLGEEGVLSDADVVAETDVKVYPTASNDEGVAELTLASGIYRVRARHPGYRARPSVAVELRPGERVTVEITLERAAPGDDAVVDTRDRAWPVEAGEAEAGDE